MAMLTSLRSKASIASLSLAILASVVAQAEQRTEAEARAIAARYLPAAVASQPLRAPRHGAATVDPSACYIFNAPANQGFVLVSGDDRLPEVLGYSHNGTIDTRDIPEALSFLLEKTQQLLESGADIVTIGTKPGNPVVQPLLGDINWGQSEPFNTFCPTLSNGNHGYVGCVATAMTQIMRYYQYPAKGAGTHSYVYGGQTISADFGSTTYDWANMPAVVPAEYTKAQEEAYSTLCFHAGVSVDMQYDPSGSGAYTHVVPGALRNNFSYSQGTRMLTREYFNTREWMDLITAELDAKRPVYYSATSEDMMGGHAFVCDGYDDAGYVHINWGWYGSSNGYFYINHLNPGELGTGSGSGAYNIQQEIITGIEPATMSKAVYQASIYGATRFTCDYYGTDMTIMTYIENLDVVPYEGEILALLVDADGKATRLHGMGVSVPEFKAGRTGSYLMTMRDVPTTVPTTVPNGKYTIRLGYEEEGQLKVLRHPIGLPAYANCEVRNNYITVENRHEPSPVASMTEPLEVLGGNIYAQGTAMFHTRLANHSTDFRLTEIVLTLIDADGKEVHTQSYTVNIYDLSEADVNFKVELPDELQPGKYTVTLAHKNHESKTFATHDGKPTEIEVLAPAAEPVLQFTGAPYAYNLTTRDENLWQRGEQMAIAIPVLNCGAAGNARLIVRLINDATGASYMLRAEDYAWSKGEQRTVTIAHPVTHDPAIYRLAYYFAGSSLEEYEIEWPAEALTAEVVENAETLIEVTEMTFPEVIAAGERVAWSITIKALADVRGTLYIRLRQNTGTNGEIAYMTTTINLKAGETKTLSGTYKPGVAGGQYYYTMVELKAGSVTLPAAGHATYYRQIAVGEMPSGIESVDGDVSAPVEWYNLQGVRIENPGHGFYLRRQGSKVEKIVL